MRNRIITKFVKRNTCPVCVTSLNSAFLDASDDEEHNVDVRVDKFLRLTYEFLKLNTNFREAIVDGIFFFSKYLTLQ